MNVVREANSAIERDINANFAPENMVGMDFDVNGSLREHNEEGRMQEAISAQGQHQEGAGRGVILIGSDNMDNPASGHIGSNATQAISAQTLQRPCRTGRRAARIWRWKRLLRLCRCSR